MCRPLQVVGLARVGWRWRWRAVGIGNDLTKIDCLLKNALLGQFWVFLDLPDVRNGSGSKFRVYGWYREVCTTKITQFRGNYVIQPPHRPFCIFLLVRCFGIRKKIQNCHQPTPPTHLPFCQTQKVLIKKRPRAIF